MDKKAVMSNEMSEYCTEVLSNVRLCKLKDAKPVISHENITHSDSMVVCECFICQRKHKPSSGYLKSFLTSPLKRNTGSL